MSDGGVTHKELNEALTVQTKLIIGKINRTEDSLKGDISEVKTDVNKDVKAIDDRVTYIERRSRTENIIASVVTFFGVIIWGRYGG